MTEVTEAKFGDYSLSLELVTVFLRLTERENFVRDIDTGSRSQSVWRQGQGHSRLQCGQGHMKVHRVILERMDTGSRSHKAVRTQSQGHSREHGHRAKVTQVQDHTRV